MRCPFCQFPDNRVLESRSAESGQSVRRRRECLRCSRRFTTYERIEFVPIVVIKRNGERESFDRSKLLKGIVRACEKTGIPHMQLENLVDEIEAELQQQAVREVASYEIGEVVLKHLQKLNEVAYIRFASVYKQFKGIKDFVEILNHLQESAGHRQTMSSSVSATEPASPETSLLERNDRLERDDRQTVISSTNH
ncbi:MAG TPA: transcriptional regulator NrdR [Allocoleopsis sp.]